MYSILQPTGPIMDTTRFDLQQEHMVCELRILPLAGLQTAYIAHTHAKSAITDAVELIGIV